MSEDRELLIKKMKEELQKKKVIKDQTEIALYQLAGQVSLLERLVKDLETPEVPK